MDEEVMNDTIYCKYCKDAISNNDERVIKKEGTYHFFCWKQKTNCEEELNFD
jgi:hypothetical protein